MKKITKNQLQALASQLFEKVGTSPEDSKTIAEVLLEASLSGYDSHGVMRIARYVDEVRKEFIKPSSSPVVVRENASTALIDGRFGFGPVTATFAVNKAAEKAKEGGVGCVTTINTNDVARLGSYLSSHGENGLFVLLMANDGGGGAAVPPWGGTTPFLSTNPIAAVIPTGSGTPILIDVSTATTSIGKLRIAANEKKQIDPGVLIKRDGSTETDPSTFFQTPRASAILPLGGVIAGHKGFALSLICEALAGALGGSACSTGEYSSYAPNGLFVLAIDPTFFGGIDKFRVLIDGLVTGLKSSDTLPDSEDILMPGERAAKERASREKDGIPVDPLTWDKLSILMREFNLGL